MPVIKVNTLNPANISVADLNQIETLRSNTRGHINTIIVPNIEHTINVSDDVYRALEDDLQALTNIKSGLLFRIEKDDGVSDNYTTRIIISDGFVHSVGIQK